MIIVVDSREQLPYAFDSSPHYEGTETVKAKLPTGDYSIKGLEHRIAIERKSLPDLIGCLTKGRARFCRELDRAAQLECFVVVVECSFKDIASGNYRSALRPWSALQSLSAWWVRYRVPWFPAGSRAASEALTWSLLQKFEREDQK